MEAVPVVTWQEYEHCCPHTIHSHTHLPVQCVCVFKPEYLKNTRRDKSWGGDLGRLPTQSWIRGYPTAVRIEMFRVSLGTPTWSTYVPHSKYLWVYLTRTLKVSFIFIQLLLWESTFKQPVLAYRNEGSWVSGDVLNVSTWVNTRVCGIGKLMIPLLTSAVSDGVSGCLSALQWAGHLSIV